jgi:hypothetical protein
LVRYKSDEINAGMVFTISLKKKSPKILMMMLNKLLGVIIIWGWLNLEVTGGALRRCGFRRAKLVVGTKVDAR